MTTINFVPKNEVDRTRILRIRHLTVAVTTAVLAVYLVAAAGIFGWWWYKFVREGKTLTRIDELQQLIQDYPDAEVVVRRLNARIDVMNNFLAGRGQASEAARILAEAKDVEVASWVYNTGGEQQVKVIATGPGQIFVFSRYLEEKYERVQPAEVGWNITEGWHGRFLLTKMKKGVI